MRLENSFEKPKADSRDSVPDAELQRQETLSRAQKLIDDAYPGKEITVGDAQIRIRGLTPYVGVYKDGQHFKDVPMWIGYKAEDLAEEVKKLAQEGL